MFNFIQVQDSLKQNPKRWLVTGAAGFIGSNLCHKLLGLGQSVTGLDNYSTGLKRNADELKNTHPEFHFIEADIRNLDQMIKAVEGKDYVLHQAALGSVPRSIDKPLESHDSNVNGMLNVLFACKERKVPLVFASSSSVYGDLSDLPKVEDKVGIPLSPYAATKATKELYARVFAATYGVHVTGLRYFNVFGPRQNPEGAYAAVIPKWIGQILKGETVEIYGDGKTSRDFCYIENAVQANIMAAYHHSNNTSGEIYNVAAEKQTTLTQLFEVIVANLKELNPSLEIKQANYKNFRPGDVRHSLADISKAQRQIGYTPSHSVQEGLKETVGWFLKNLDPI